MSDLQPSLASAPWLAPQPLVEPTPRWIRVKCDDRVIADSRRALLLRVYGGPGQLPTYFFPQEDVLMDILEPSGKLKDGRTYYNIREASNKVENATWSYLSPPPALSDLEGYITFSWWNPRITWYEEAEQVYVHARDPYKRVDTLGGSSHVRVSIEGETLAETWQPVLLFETSLPTRYYIRVEDVRMDLLEPSDFKSQCPYKGTAKYWSARLGDRLEENVVWSYPEPIAECPKIKNLLCFFNENVDLYIDGQLQDRPITPWSR